MQWKRSRKDPNNALSKWLTSDRRLLVWEATSNRASNLCTNSSRTSSSISATRMVSFTDPWKSIRTTSRVTKPSFKSWLMPIWTSSRQRCRPLWLKLRAWYPKWLSGSRETKLKSRRSWSKSKKRFPYCPNPCGCRRTELTLTRNSLKKIASLCTAKRSSKRDLWARATSLSQPRMVLMACSEVLLKAGCLNLSDCQSVELDAEGNSYGLLQASFKSWPLTSRSSSMDLNSTLLPIWKNWNFCSPMASQVSRCPKT